MKRVCGVVALVVATTTWLGPPAEAAAPNTIIKSGPTGKIASTTASFAFKAKPKKGTTFKCRMDSARWKKCTSPVTYTGLGQGDHTFAVRAKRDGKVDRTPATRAFTVDTVGPETTLVNGPGPVVDDHTPTFTFSASEAGATFACRLGAAAFSPCTSPWTLPETPDEVYTFEVRAQDALGNPDASPASRTFEILTPITKDLATAQAAAAYLIPDSADIDIAANCPTVDCPDGVPAPPADQIHLTSTRTVTEVVGQNRYDVDATVNVTTLVPVKVTYAGATCDLAATSANGAFATWHVLMQLNFVHPPGSSEWRIQPSNTNVTQVEDADLTITGVNLLCALAGTLLGALKATLQDALASQLSATLCAARGPDYLGPCPTP